MNDVRFFQWKIVQRMNHIFLDQLFKALQCDNVSTNEKKETTI